MTSYIERRKFLATLGGAAVAWPLAARAQQPVMPVVGFLRGTSSADSGHLVAVFRQGLREAGVVGRCGLSYRMGVSEIILVPLPKRLRICGRHLFHIVAQLGKFASDVVRSHPRFDANETRRQVRKPRGNASARHFFSQHDGAAGIEADHVKRVFAHIYFRWWPLRGWSSKAWWCSLS